MAVRIHLQFATPQMRLARPITDVNGRLVAGVGTMLSARVVRVLRHMAVQSVLVEDAATLSAWEKVQTADEELAALRERFVGEPMTPALEEIHAALARRIERRAAERSTGQSSEVPS
jgi:hypothetical protein